MKQKVLAILEVSQKQAYIFSSNKLQENVIRSGIIAWVTSPDFFEEAAQDLFDRENNLVYAGGGHIVLQFDDKETARKFVNVITRKVMQQYPGLELFAKIYPTSAEPAVADLHKLIELLEQKKSVRAASFSQGTFGIEKTDTRTGDPVRANHTEEKIPVFEQEKDDRLIPEGFLKAKEFEKLGGTQGDKNYIAVVHIDGNSMGKRVQELQSSLQSESWETARRKLRAFSEAIDRDFTEAYMDMCNSVSAWIRKDVQAVESLSVRYREKGGPDDGKYYFPVRRIISAGDDICFVTDGRIGLECARIFMEKLAEKTNAIDKKGYASCAGVAIVHVKYPFFKAYELAESLCSNAKRYIATRLGQDASAFYSAIDWHIEQGEIGDSLEIVKNHYEAEDRTSMTLRPYIVCGDRQRFEKEKQFEDFRTLVKRIQLEDETYARSKYKKMREVIRLGKTETENYCRIQLLYDPGRFGSLLATQEQIRDPEKLTAGRLYVTLEDGTEHARMFDAIEIMDMFAAIEEEDTGK